MAKLNWVKQTNSEMQLRDVAKILKRGYDENYVRLWANKLGVENLLDQTLESLDENDVG